MGGSTAGKVAVVMAVSWGHESGEEWASGGSLCWRRLGVVSAQIAWWKLGSGLARLASILRYQV
jgi:hypothetical protein